VNPTLRAWRRAATAAAGALTIAACNPSLPESSSTGARLYEERCAVCHRLYPPGVLTAATWDIMLDRMQGEMRRRGIEPLSGDEMRVLRDYLNKHALRPGEAHDEG
jgi:cytochrome c5